MKIPQGWELRQLSNCSNGSPKYGLNASSVEYSEELPTYLRITDIDDSGKFIKQNKRSVKSKDWKNYLLSLNDIVFARTGATVGKTYLYNRSDDLLVYAGYLIKFALNTKKIIPEYLKFYTETQRYWHWVKVTSQRSGQPGINATEYAGLKLLLPPLVEQKKIVEILLCWDESIENIENLITAKKTFKKGIIQKLLSGQVRFKGFNGKAEYSKLKGLVKEVSRRNRSSKAGTVLSVTNTSGFVVQTDHFDRSVASTDISNYKIVRQGQFGFNPSRVNVGSIAMLEEDIEGALSPMYVIFETVEDKLLPEYMKQFIKSSWFIGHVRCLTQGSVRDSLSFDALEQIRIFAPSIDEQKRIADTLSAIDKEIKLLEQKRDSLKKQKKGLMQKLLTGKIRVKV